MLFGNYMQGDLKIIWSGVLMKLFQPKRVFFEEAALNYPLGVQIFDQMTAAAIPLKMITHNRVTGIPGDSPQQSFREGKQTMVVGVKKDLRFDTCKPSADFEMFQTLEQFVLMSPLQQGSL